MATRAKFPGLKSKAWHPFFKVPPEKGEDEDADLFARRMRFYEALRDAALEVQMLDRDTYLDFENRLLTVHAKERARRLAAPDDPTINTEHVTALRAVHLAVVKAYVLGVRGIEVGDVNLDDVREPEVIATLLSTAGILADASAIARDAQAPSPVQLEH